VAWKTRPPGRRAILRPMPPAERSCAGDQVSGRRVRAPPAHFLVPIQIGRVAYVLRDGTKRPVPGQSIKLSLLVTAMGTG
jgi:hypothetical protein